MRISKIAAALFLALGCAACSGPIDDFGNQQEPHGFESSIMFESVTHYAAASRPDLAKWCKTYNGKLSNDGYGCAVEWNRLITTKGWPCTEATVPMDSDRARSVKRFMDDVCNGWVPLP